MNEKITLSGVPETMLQTLYARAKETCLRGAIRDEKAAALVERIDYDFSLADKDAAMRSSIEIGDKVTTIGGIVGIVCAIADKDDTIVIETGSDRTKIRFRRTAISSGEKLDAGKDSKSTTVKK